MSNEQTWRDGLAAIQARDWTKFRNLVTDDFSFVGGPMPMNLDAFMATQGAIGAAMPDFTFHVDKIAGSGDSLTCELHVTATHTAALSLPVPGMPSIPATNKHVTVPDYLIVTFRGGKVASVETKPPANGGMGALLHAVGVPL
jgi:predicted ester cyclase